ncbi:hypothetical protein C8J45_105298 [Sphingomonas sp. PP-CE-3G-477]|uniref:hypothetical protein n=1 Tax=Sphingomonas sp. PP-CE-3G-477 TaxID=2135660 RepID=UPI000D4BB923|nr:hypothetical protein [Sphingomonas sp. PP-CE-3G-477]PTQ63721.1 hypothetical protein C8J45_105298 [Sphingomonas sp. PP-CE-3G-477]
MKYEKIPTESLLDKAKNDLHETLLTYSGSDVELLNTGLVNLIDHLDKGLRGELNPRYYLSSIDPGIGKTECYCSFIKSWKKMGFNPEGSILIAVHTKEEIRSIIRRCGLDSEDFACLTGEDATNELGRGEAGINSARVLFTTHAMLHSRTAGKLFSSAKEFHYLGAPRTLRIWDEAFLLAQPVTLSMHDLTRLSHSIRSTDPHLLTSIDALATRMVDGAADDCIVVPREIASLASAAKGAKQLSDTEKRTLRYLTLVAGTAMVLRSVGGVLGRVLVGASAPLPADVAPVIILDASGRVRGTYKAQEAGTAKLVRLTPSVRDYGNVRVHVCKTTAGKTGLAGDAYREQLYRASAKIIDSKPHEEWLVISYKSDNTLDIESDIKSFVAKPSSIRFLNWGRHHGTNEFRDCKNILIIGSHLYGPDGYHALELAASGLPADKFHGPSKGFAADELCHNLLQAVMRGNARSGISSIAGECDVYVFVSNKYNPVSCIKAALPNCNVRDWNALNRSLRGSAKKAFDYIASYFSSTTAKSLTKANVSSHIGIKSASSFARIIRSAVFKDKLNKIGVGIARTTFTRMI